MKKLVTVFVLVFVVSTIAILSIKPKYTIDASDETPEQMLKRFEVEDETRRIKNEKIALDIKTGKIKNNNELDIAFKNK